MSQNDYGRRFYVSDQLYPDQMRQIPFSAMAQRALVKHSEFKKPYMFPNYQEMEYVWDPPPGFGFYYPGLDYPWLGFPLPNLGDDVNPCNLVFMCDLGDMCWCKGETLCFAVSCFHPIVRIEFEYDWFSDYFSVTGGGSILCITAVESPIGIPSINLYMSATCDGVVTIGSHMSLEIQECWPPDDKCCNGDNYNAPEWSDDSIESIGATSEGIIAIKDDEFDAIYGLPPYTWSLSGNGSGFFLQNTVTMTKENVLITVSACGTIDITVTDRCGNICSGSVASVYGQWSAITSSTAKAVPSNTDLNGGEFPCSAGIGYQWDIANQVGDYGVIHSSRYRNCNCYSHRKESLAGCMSRHLGFITSDHSFITEISDNPCAGFDADYLCEACGPLYPDGYYTCLEWYFAIFVNDPRCCASFLYIGMREWECW